MKKNVHVTYKHDVWNVIGEGNKKSSNVFKTKTEALEKGKNMAINKGVELVIHGRNGKIQDKDSYGNDPIPPRDRKM